MVKRDRWGNVIPENGKEGDTTINVNVDADNPPTTNTTVEKKIIKKEVVEEEDKGDDVPTPSTVS